METNKKNIETQIIKRPDGRTTIAHHLDLGFMANFMDYAFIERVNEKMAEKAVKEIWKKHGASIMKKVDKKTIGNLTVKKLTTLIAKELKV